MKIKVIYILILSFFSCAIIYSQEVFKSNELTISKIEPGSWVVETADMGAMYIVEGSERAMLIDTGTKCEGLDEIVRKITNKPLYVVLTHNHGDHSGNANYFDEIYMHPLDTLVSSRVPFNGKYHWLKDGDVFDLGGRKIEVVWMPGHTPGSIVLLDKTVQAAYAGDSFGSGEAWLQLKPNLPMKTYYESCVRMEEIMQEQGVEKLYLGHYPYQKRAMGMEYLLNMKQLAGQLSNGDESGSKPYKYKGRSARPDENPAFVEQGDAIIVYDRMLF